LIDSGGQDDDMSASSRQSLTAAGFGAAHPPPLPAGAERITVAAFGPGDAHHGQGAGAGIGPATAPGRHRRRAS